MTNNTNIGVKKSAFTTGTTIPNSATFDYVSNGQNFKITFAGFLGQAGLSLNLEQLGNPATTAVLDTVGSTNRIRNIGGTNGISVGLDASSGVQVSTNFTFDATGAPLVPDSAAEKLAFKSLVGGTGIMINDSPTSVTINGVAPLNQVIINQASDFPAESGGVITLAADTEYFIGSDVTVNFPFVLSGNCSVTGNPVASTLRYLGSGTMFTGIDAGNFDLSNLQLEFPNADLLDMQNVSAVNQNVVQLYGLYILNGKSFGSFKDLLGMSLDTIVIFLIGSGLTDAGTVTSFLTVNKMGFFSVDPTFIGFDLGSNAYVSLEISNVRFTSPVGGVGIAGLANNGNLQAGEVSTILSNEFTGGCIPLQGITEDDYRHNFIANGGIKDTQPDSLISLSSNATATVISASATPVKIAGTWVVEQESHFSGDTTGRSTYNAERTITAPITASVALAPASGTNKVIKAYFYKNGTQISNSGVEIRADNGTPIPVTLIWQEILEQNDYIEVWVENNSDTVDIVASDAVLRVR